MKFLMFILAVVCITSCKKPEDRACFKSAGDLTSITFDLPDFETVKILEKLEVTLIQDSINYIEIHGRNHLIHQVAFEINDEGVLVLENKNKCGFLRAYKKNEIQIDLHVKTLREIQFFGTFDLHTKGIINTPTFTLKTEDSGATAHLNVNCGQLFISQGHGYGDFTVSGTCNTARIMIQSNGFGNTEHLIVANELYVSNNTPVTSTVNIDGAIATIAINGTGNVIYKGVADSLIRVGSGSGMLVNGN